MTNTSKKMDTPVNKNPPLRNSHKTNCDILSWDMDSDK